MRRLLFSVAVTLLPVGNADALQGPAGPSFPTIFRAAWGVGGPDCRRSEPRVVIRARSAVIEGVDAVPRRLTRLRSNVIRVELMKSRGGQRWRDVETLTVGTTGSRLFRERRGGDLRIYTICEPGPHETVPERPIE